MFDSGPSIFNPRVTTVGRSSGNWDQCLQGGPHEWVTGFFSTPFPVDLLFPTLLTTGRGPPCRITRLDLFHPNHSKDLYRLSDFTSDTLSHGRTSTKKQTNQYHQQACGELDRSFKRMCCDFYPKTILASMLN